MRRVKRDGPWVYRDKLYGAGAGIMVVGSESWYAWLADEEAREFVFPTVEGGWHRARREWRRNTAYWYVACRVAGQVRRFYLGPAEALDSTRLQDVAAAIAAAREQAPEG